ncbi:hypothetical protein ACH5RR_019125 [Cinchona calisaya]|uniref:Uncharacterized protein n=1 Tax=Cinchona calisaya TaxID=153742 RepID=A0ABD2ZQ70_9GENT
MSNEVVEEIGLPDDDDFVVVAPTRAPCLGWVTPDIMEKTSGWVGGIPWFVNGWVGGFNGRMDILVSEGLFESVYNHGFDEETFVI